jgi:hypothetical protein
MNRLLIGETPQFDGGIVYKVYESQTKMVYMVTRNKKLAEELVIILKSEYQQELYNAN